MRFHDVGKLVNVVKLQVVGHVQAKVPLWYVQLRVLLHVLCFITLEESIVSPPWVCRQAA